MSIYDDPAYAEFLKGYAPAAAPEPSKKKLETYWSDMPNKVGMGILGLGKMGVNALVGNDNATYDFLESEIKRGQGQLSPEQRRQDAATAAVMADESKGLGDVAKSYWDNPRALAGMIAESTPSMVAGGGVGGLLVRGGAAMTGAALGRVGAMAASGVGQGSIMAADVFEKTGSGEAALKALALGTATGFIPGSAENVLTRKFAGEAIEGISDVVVPGLAKAGVLGAAKRTGAAIGAEAGQEFVEETGQALIEQGANGGTLNLHSAMKQGVAGAMAGGVMGGGTHIVAGDGSKQRELEIAEKVLAQDPTNPVAQAEVSLLRAQRDYVEAAPEQREALKPAIEVAKAAVLAARMPGSRAAADNLDTARAEVVLDTAGMTGARVAADAVSAETKQAIAEAKTGDEAREAFAKGDEAHTTLTVDTKAVQNVRQGAVQGTVEAVQEEVARIKEGRLASTTINEAAFPVEEVPRVAANTAPETLVLDAPTLGLPKVSDTIGLTRDTPAEVQAAAMAEAAAAPLPTIDTNMVTAATKTAAVDNLALPSINEDMLKAPPAVEPAVGSPEFMEAAKDRVIDAEQEMRGAGFSPEVGQMMRGASDDQLRSYVQDPGTHISRSNFASALLAARGTPVSQTMLAARREVESGIEALAAARNVDAEAVRRAVAGLNIESARAILANPASADQHALVRAAATLRGWDVSDVVVETEGTVTAEMVAKLDAEDMITSRGKLKLFDELRDEFVDSAPDDVIEALFDAERFVITPGADLADFDKNTAEVVAWGVSDEGRDAGVNLNAIEDLVEARVILGLVAEQKKDKKDKKDEEGLSQDEMYDLQDELQAELSGVQQTADIDAKIAEWQEVADNEDMDDVYRSEARAKLRQLREQRAQIGGNPGTPVPAADTRRAEARAAFVDYYRQNGTPEERINELAAEIEANPVAALNAPNLDQRAVTYIEYATRLAALSGVPSITRDFGRRAADAKNDGTLAKLGAAWKQVMGGRGQRALTVNTRDLTDTAVGVAPTNRQLKTLKNKYNAALKAAAVRWGEANNQPVDLANWQDPVVSIESNANHPTWPDPYEIKISVKALGRGNQNPYMVKPGSATGRLDYHANPQAPSITSTGLRAAENSSDLAYRLAAEIANMQGVRVFASGTLLTNNNVRRHLQSISMDHLLGTGRLLPVSYGNYTSEQGVPGAVWERASDDEQAGLNLFRLVHQMGVDRGRVDGQNTRGENNREGISKAAWAQNLRFREDGSIYAAHPPTTTAGFPEGTEVSDQMLKDKVSETHSFERTGAGGFGENTLKLGIMLNTMTAAVEGKPNARIPGWMVTTAKRIGRDAGGWFFSETETAPAAGITKAEAENTVREVVGDKVAQVLLDTGLVSFVETPAELAELGGVPLTSVGRGVQGATLPDGRIVLVTGNLTSEKAAAVLQHEALHATLKALVGEDTYNRLMSRLDTLVKAGEGSSWVKDARAAVPKGTPAEDVTEEVAAYAVEQYVANPESTNPLVKWARDFMSAIRSAIIQNKTLPEALRVWAIQNVQPQDLARMAVAGLKKSAVGAGNLRTSKRDWDAEIAALMEEHKTADRERRVEINDELRSLTAFRTAQNELDYEAEFRKQKGRTNETGNIRGEAAGVPAQAEYGIPRAGAVSVDATHFSGDQRTQLSTSAYGTGARGEEAGRLALPENADIRQRTHFYVNEGSGIRPEAGVGAVAHNVKLNNLYDIKADPQGYRALNRNDVNAMERAIVNAGFDGYYAPNYANGQGVAVVIGQHTIPVSPGEGGTNAVEQFQGDTYAANLANSKLPGGAMSGREWLVSIKGTEFDTAPVRAELENRQNQRIYRDDLPRFNKRIKFSIAQEIDTVTSPVAPSAAPGNELIITNRSGRSAHEYLMETLRGWIQDKHVTLRRIQQLAGVTAEKMAMDTMGALDRLGSKMSSKQKHLVLRPLAAIESILEKDYRKDGDKAGENAHKDMNDLLIALHVPEYNDRMATINPAKYAADGRYLTGFDAEHPGSGIKTEDALKTKERLLNGPHAKALTEAVDKYRTMINDLQDYAVERGLENAEVIKAWRDEKSGFPNYTPFHRELDLDENHGIGTARGAQGFSLRTGITQRAMGSAAEIFDPLASTLVLGTRIVSRGENAVVARTMFAFASAVVPKFQTRGGALKDMWKVDVVPQTRVIKNTNVYQVRLADGSLSAEFYNREQARLYADAKQAEWEAANPNVDPDTSGIIAEFIETAERVFIQDQPNYLGDENVMVIPIEGENHIITFDKDSEDGMAILNALKGKNTVGGSAGTKVLNQMLTPFRMFSRWTVSMATGFNPIFMPFNSARDVQAAMINAKDGGVPGWQWSDSRGIAKNFFPAAKGIWNQLSREFEALHSNTGEAPPPEEGSWAWWMQQAEVTGGLTGVMQHITEPEDARTMIRRLYGSSVESNMVPANEAQNWLTKGTSGLAKIGDAFYRFGEGETKGAMRPGSVLAAKIAQMNTAGELATRTAVFKRATEKYMEQGYSKEEAMQLAAVISKNISTNFNRRGAASTFLNQMFPFFNAAVQGSARMAEALFEKGTYTVKKDGKVFTDQKTRLTPFGKKVITGLAALGAAQAALLAYAGFDDNEPPEAIKDRAFIIPLGGDTKNYIAIPMPHGFNTLINFGREVTDALIQGAQGNFKKAAGHIIQGTAGQMAAFNPLGGQGNLMLGASPALLDPAVALYMNEDVFGRQIAREDMNPRDKTAGFTRTKEGGSTWGRAIAEGLNTITGGNADQPGLISPTGDQIDYLAGELGGGLTREAGKVFGLGVAGFKSATGTPREELPMNKVPLIGRLYGEINSTTGVRQRAFEISGELNSLKNRYDGLRERGDKEGAAAFKAEHPELSLADDFNRFYRADSKAKKQRALSRDSDAIEKVNQITETQTTKARALLEKYDKLKP